MIATEAELARGIEEFRDSIEVRERDQTRVGARIARVTSERDELRAKLSELTAAAMAYVDIPPGEPVIALRRRLILAYSAALKALPTKFQPHRTSR